MHRHDKLAPLSREHHRILVLAQVVRSDTPAYRGMPADVPGKVAYATEQLDSLLLPHMQREEKMLFPKIRGHHEDIDDLVDELTTEHGAITGMIRALDTAANAEQALHTIGIILNEHVRKEERRLFELAQQHVPAAVLEELAL